MRLIGQAHTMLHKNGVMRIQTDIRVGSRYHTTRRLDCHPKQLMIILGSTRSRLSVIK